VDWRVAARAATAGPLVVSLAIVLGFAAAERVGRPVLTYAPPANLAEAAALANAGEVLRRLRAGEDPAAIQPVRPDAISSAVPLASAHEAAIWSRRVELVALMAREGALPTEPPLHLVCLAVDLGVDDIVAYLSPGAPPLCEPGAATARVMARAE